MNDPTVTNHDCGVILLYIAYLRGFDGLYDKLDMIKQAIIDAIICLDYVSEP